MVANEIMRIVPSGLRKRRGARLRCMWRLLPCRTEREAIEHIMAELDGNEGFVVASRIADKVGITRSVIVSAPRFECRCY